MIREQLTSGTIIYVDGEIKNGTSIYVPVNGNTLPIPDGFYDIEHTNEIIHIRIDKGKIKGMKIEKKDLHKYRIQVIKEYKQNPKSH